MQANRSLAHTIYAFRVAGFSRDPKWPLWPSAENLYPLVNRGIGRTADNDYGT